MYLTVCDSNDENVGDCRQDYQPETDNSDHQLEIVSDGDENQGMSLM